MDDLRGHTPGIDRLRDSNGEVKELGAGALFPARVESHRNSDSIRNKSKISCRLPRNGALVAAAVETRELCPTVRKLVVKEKLEALVAEMIERKIYLDEALGEFEKRFIQNALTKTRGNQTKAAQVLGVHRNTLNRKIAQHKLNGHR